LPDARADLDDGTAQDRPEFLDQRPGIIARLAQREELKILRGGGGIRDVRGLGGN